MRICTPIDFKPHGGGYYFLKALQDHVIRLGWEVTTDIDTDYDLLFTNHWMVSERNIYRAIRRNPSVRIIQRINGSAINYGRNEPEADRTQGKVNNAANLTVYQSQYSKDITHDQMKIIHQDGPIITNPVDLETFNPEGKKGSFPHEKLVAVASWSANPMKGAADVYQVARENPDIGFVLCGQYEDAPDLLNLYLQGVLGREDLARALRSCQMLLTFSRNEACPNHVLEALASGLPVLYIDSGAMREVIGEAGLPVTTDNFRAQYEMIAEQLPHYKQLARDRAVTMNNPDVIFSEYIEAMLDTFNRSGGKMVFRWMKAWAFELFYRVKHFDGA